MNTDVGYCQKWLNLPTSLKSGMLHLLLLSYVFVMMMNDGKVRIYFD